MEITGPIRSIVAPSFSSLFPVNWHERLAHASRWRRRRQDQIAGDIIVEIALARLARRQLAVRHFGTREPAKQCEVDRCSNFICELVGLFWREVQPPEFGAKLATKRIPGSVPAPVDRALNSEATILPLKPLADRAFVPEPGLQCVATGAPIGVVFDEQFDELGRAIFFVNRKAGDQPAMLLQDRVDQGKD